MKPLKLIEQERNEAMLLVALGLIAVVVIAKLIRFFYYFWKDFDQYETSHKK